MALPGFSVPPTSNAPAPLTVPAPGAALRRLPRLHDESRMALRRAALLDRTVPAAGGLLAIATLAALLGGGTLAATFAWSVLIFFGVAAVLASHLRAASVFKELAGSPADMRAILLYLGISWGMGTFLALAPHPAALLLFAAAPGVMIALMLGDVPAILAFTGPVTVLTLDALLLRCESLPGAAALLAVSAGIVLLVWRRHCVETSQKQRASLKDQATIP